MSVPAAELLITDIKEISSRRRLIYINYEAAFALYPAELKRFSIKKDSVISVDVYQQLLTEIFQKRAVLRAMNLLKNKDYTEKELHDKLKKDYYPNESVLAALEYVSRYGYLDDKRYAENYVHFKGEQKSRKQIELHLMQKGISTDLIESVCDSYYNSNSDTELNMILKQLKKNTANISSVSYEQRMKLMASFYRKGFRSDTIKKAFDLIQDDNNI